MLHSDATLVACASLNQVFVDINICEQSMQSHNDWGTRPSRLKHRNMLPPSVMTRSLENTVSGGSDNHNSNSSSDEDVEPSTIILAILLIFLGFVVLPLSLKLWRLLLGEHGEHGCMSVFLGHPADTETSSQAPPPQVRNQDPQRGAPAEHRRHPNNPNAVSGKGMDRNDIQKQLVTSLFETKEAQDVIDCPICLASLQNGEEVAQSMNPDCSHLFHADCIITWLVQHPDCPQCRRDFLYSSSASSAKV